MSRKGLFGGVLGNGAGAGLGVGDDSPAAPGVAHMGQIYAKTTSKGRGHPSLRLGSLGWRT